MKSILYSFLILFATHLMGQPMVGSDAIVNIGEEVPTTFLGIQELNWDSGISGPNINWDFTSLSMGAECDYIAMDPITSPYYDSFPDSDIYFVCTFSDSQGFEAEQHTFYEVSGDILQLSGNVSISISNPNFDSIFIVYTDLLDWGTFPYSYEGNSDDTFAARITSYIGNQTILVNQTGTSTHEVDSYGTLTTPAGTFENTLRVKRVELAENSIPNVPFTSPQESYRYTWYAENENGVILNLDSIVIKDFNGNIVSSELTGSYRTMGPTSTSTFTILDDDISIYPNPVVEELNIELTNLSDYKLYIYTVDGEEIPYSLVTKSNNSLRINFANADIKRGIYFIKLFDVNNDNVFSKAILINN